MSIYDDICLPGIKSGIFCQLGDYILPTTFSKKNWNIRWFWCGKGDTDSVHGKWGRTNKQYLGVTSRYMYSMWLMLLMEEILHQLIGSLSHHFTKVWKISGGPGFQPSTVHTIHIFTWETNTCVYNKILSYIIHSIQYTVCIQYTYQTVYMRFNGVPRTQPTQKGLKHKNRNNGFQAEYETQILNTISSISSSFVL